MPGTRPTLVIALLSLTALLGVPACSPPSDPVVVPPVAPPAVETTPVAPPAVVPLGEVVLEFENVDNGYKQPLFVTGAGDGSKRLFVVEKTGRVWIWALKDGKRHAEPFLDLSKVVSTSSEQGLLGLAFSPSFRRDGLFYVNYTRADGATVVSRFQAALDSVVGGSETVLLTVAQPYANHNGGMLAFGPDGYLYVGLGDGGSGGDPKGNGQNLGTLLGTLLRIDVGGTGKYAIPKDNPFVGRTGARPEIWAWGLRNPWRFSFDRETGDLWIGDVGQNAWEEIDFQPAASAGGENYGWNHFEGTHPYPSGSKARSGEYVAPVIEYDRAAGQSVTGGYVYRGKQQPALLGTYIYGDFSSGRVWGARRTAGGIENRLLAESGFAISSFGEDDDGELYVVDYNGAIYRLTAK
jgi:glucose/arabinose dehydrogenase